MAPESRSDRGFTDAHRARLAEAGAGLPRKALLELSSLVTPDTLRRWYRRLVAAKYDGSARRSPGRPRTPADLRDLVLRLARENPSWGYTRIRDVLHHLGHDLARSTIAAILKDAGLTPASDRDRGTPLADFLAAHLGQVAALDFFTVEVLTLAGLVRFHVLFVIDLATREVEVAGISHQPFEAWMLQVTRHLTDPHPQDGFLKDHRYLIMDRDPLFTAKFRALLERSGVSPVRLPARSPNLNAFAERFVLSIKTECLAKIIPLGERHLRWAIREYISHYLSERPHQGLDGAFVDPRLPTAAKCDGEIVCDRRLGGLLKSYRRAA
jgi:transposase InsO family protein